MDTTKSRIAFQHRHHAYELQKRYLQSYPNTQKYFLYVNSMEQLAILNRYKFKTQSVISDYLL